MRVPEYQHRILAILQDNTDPVIKHNDERTYKDQTIGLHSPSQSYLKIIDNGDINVLTEDNTGMMINKESKTTTVFADEAYTVAPIVSTKCDPYGLIINQYTLNPDFYLRNDEDLRIKGDVRYWVEATETVPAHWARRGVYIRPFYTRTQLQRMGVLKR